MPHPNFPHRIAALTLGLPAPCALPAWSQGPTAEVPPLFDDDRADAPVRVVDFADCQCPYRKRFSGKRVIGTQRPPKFKAEFDRLLEMAA